MEQWDPDAYDAWYETPLGAVSDRLEKELVFSMACVKKGEKALDAGCGTGIYSIELTKRGALTTGVDSSGGMLDRAKSKAVKDGHNIDFVCADALTLPFPDNYFDLVLSIGMLCYTEEREKALLEMRRVLKPGGRIIIGVLNKWSPWALFRRTKGLFKETIYNKAEFIAPPYLELSLGRAGFEVKKLKTCLYFFPINCNIYIKLYAPFEKIGGAVAPRMGAFLAVLSVKS